MSLVNSLVSVYCSVLPIDAVRRWYVWSHSAGIGQFGLPSPLLPVPAVFDLPPTTSLRVVLSRLGTRRRHWTLQSRHT